MLHQSGHIAFERHSLGSRDDYGRLGGVSAARLRKPSGAAAPQLVYSRADGLALKRLLETSPPLVGGALILKGDVADADCVEEAAAALEQTFGPIDLWINNAMATVFGATTRSPPSADRRHPRRTYARPSRKLLPRYP